MQPGEKIDLQIQFLQDDGGNELREFISQHQAATIFNTHEWHGIIQRTYGHPVQQWTARAVDGITGAFQATVIRHPLLGSKMIALPYQFHSGMPLASDQRVAGRLIDQGIAYAHEQRVKYFEIRHHEPVPYLEERGFVSVKSNLVTTMTPLEGISLKQMRKGHRTETRYALKRGVQISETRSLDDLRTFRRLYLAEGRHHGSPQAGWPYFRNLYEMAGEAFRHTMARSDDGRYLGGLLTLDDGGIVFLRNTAYSSAEARDLKVGTALNWYAMESAAARGCQYYHWGITWTGDAGLIRYKEGWNGTSKPVHLYVISAGSTPHDPGNYFEGFKFVKAVWRHMPRFLVDHIGHVVTRWVC